MLKNLTLFVLLLSSPALSQGIDDPVKKLGSYGYLLENHRPLNINDYQIGDEWGKIQVTEAVMNRSEALRRTALATARIGGATGFVLGEFQGEVVVATNHHVCPSASRWSCRDIRFPLLNNLKVTKKDFLGTWPNIDLTLLTVSVSGDSQRKLLSVAKNFDFEAALTPGLPLITSGFGIAGNSRRSMMINFDDDCRVISMDQDFRLMGDPDEKNPADYEAWSFSNGCDVSHGDSGSAMVDATTSSPIGIIWTGRIPKNASAQRSANILSWQQRQSEEVWQELSYAVPAQKIREHLRQKLDRGDIERPYRDLIEAVIR